MEKYTDADLAFHGHGQKYPEMLTGNISGALNTVMFPVVANRADDLEDAARLIRESIVFVGVADIICHCSPCGNSRRPLFRKPGAFDGQD